MGIRDEMMADMKQAMKDKDNATRDTLRLLLAAVKQVEVDSQKELDEAAVQAIVMKQGPRQRGPHQHPQRLQGDVSHHQQAPEGGRADGGEDLGGAREVPHRRHARICALLRRRRHGAGTNHLSVLVPHVQSTCRIFLVAV